MKELELAIENLPINIIKRDDFFNISSHRSKALQSLLDAVGEIICPLWVLKDSNTLILIDGYSRIEWAEKKGLLTLPCIIFPEGFSTIDLLIKKIYAILSVRTLDIIEKAKFIARLDNFLDPAEIKERFFSILNIPKKPRMYKTLLKIGKLPEAFLSPIVRGYISEKSLMSLIWWDEESVKEAFKIFSSVKFSVSTQMEIIGLIEDLSRIKEKSPYRIIKDLEIQNLLENTDLPPSSKAEKIRILLKKELFPTLTQKEESFRKILKNLSLPKAVKLESPPFFEGDVWQLTISFTNVSELENYLTLLLKTNLTNRLSSLIQTEERTHHTND